MISNSLPIASYFALLSVNALDAVLTQIALSKRGLAEKVTFTRRLIEELGLNCAMLVKSLLPIPLVILVVMCWNYAILGYIVSLAFIILTIQFSYVVSHGCIELWRSDNSLN